MEEKKLLLMVEWLCLPHFLKKIVISLNFSNLFCHFLSWHPSHVTTVDIVCFEIPSMLSFICLLFAFDLCLPAGATTDYIPEKGEGWCESAVCGAAE